MQDRLTPKQVAEKLQLPLSTLHYYVSTEQIPHERLSRKVVRFDPTSVEDWLARKKVEARNDE
jgi:excisionase family DNA binding protein